MSMSSFSRRRVLQWIGIALLACAAMPGLARAHMQPALWHSQEFKFGYRSSTSLYDCGVLRQKVLQVLGELGAHANSRVDPISCQVARGVDAATQFATMRIVLVAPVPVTAAIKRELAATMSRQALLDRLGARTQSTLEFPAIWRDVNVGRSQLTRFDSTDCELLQQMREQVLSKLAIKVLAHDRGCSMQRLRRPTLKVAVLVPAGNETIGRLGAR